LIQEDSKRSNNQYILFKIAATACHDCHESGFWRVHLSARLPQRTEHAILWHKYFTRWCSDTFEV